MMNRFSKRFIYFPVIISVLTLMGSRFVTSPFIKYPIYTVAIASIMFSIFYTFRSGTNITSRKRLSKFVDVLAFLSISLTVFVGHAKPTGIYDIYYPIAVCTAILLAYRLTSFSVNTPIALSQIILLAITLRSTIWFAYPYFGADKFHIAAVGWIVANGEIVPPSVTYYHNFPPAHVLSASSTLISNLPLSTGYFVLGVSQAISIIGVFIFCRSILNSNRGALLGSLYTAVAGFHLKSGGEPFAQALLIALIPIIFYLVFETRSVTSKRRSGILLGLTLVAVVTQNIAPLVLVSAGFIIIGSTIFVRIIRIRFSHAVKYKIKPTLLSFFIISGIYWHILANYFHYDVGRVLNILLFTESGSNTQTDTASGVPTVELFNLELPSILMWGAPILANALILIIFGYVILSELITDDQAKPPLQYAFFASFMFAGLAGVFAAGSENAVRALPAIVIFLSPVLGYVGIKSRWKGKFGRPILAIILIALVVTSGVLTPLVAKAEWSDDDFHKYLNDDQVAAADFAILYTKSTASGPYVADYNYYTDAMSGKDPDPVIHRGFNQNSQSSINEFQEGLDSGKMSLYLDYYSTAFGLDSPESRHQIYSSGNTTVYT
ncbi:hypothetical protein DM2_669 [Halorubrum sp. DM2]|uniref:hypothetical protein n=1 Tax=Halorubrum sp. DM2 TaxID=2527867 RepID=UPI0024B714E4|nr:hypothetical protein [Halorubrum sp. DM2]VTT87335.1 hypothetical protein DM2_669 [Halorubrum sp. DM2]